MHHPARLTSVVLVVMGFHHIDQAGLELLTSGDLPASASQYAGIIGCVPPYYRCGPLCSAVVFLWGLTVLPRLEYSGA